MYSQNELLDLYKNALMLRSDFQLAKTWQIEQSRICQYRTGRLWLTLEQQLMIADALNVEPLEIIISVDFQKKRTNKDSEVLKKHYFEVLKKSIGIRMSINSGARYFPR